MYGSKKGGKDPSLLMKMKKKKKDTILVRKLYDRKKGSRPYILPLDAPFLPSFLHSQSLSLVKIQFNTTNPAFVHVKLAFPLSLTHSLTHLVPIAWTRQFGNRRNGHRLVALFPFFYDSRFTIHAIGERICVGGPVVRYSPRKRGSLALGFTKWEWE